MKRKISIKALTALLTVLIPILSWADNSITYTATYDYSKLTLGTDTLGGVTYTTVAYEGLYNDGEPGTPSLPVDYIRFSVPYNATNFSVTANPNRSTNANLDNMLYPCQASYMMSDTSFSTIIMPDTDAYYSGNTYPNEPAWIVDEGFLAGENHVVTVALMPFLYCHTFNSDIIRMAQVESLRLSYEISDSLSFYPIVRNDESLRQEGYELTKSMVVNPNDVLRHRPLTMSTNYAAEFITNSTMSNEVLNKNDYLEDNESVNESDINSKNLSNNPDRALSGDYPYLIVTTQEYYHPLRRLAALNSQKGYRVKVVTMDEVINTCSGDLIILPNGTHEVAFNDSAGALRQFLRNYYILRGTKYVLLVGNGVPYRSYTHGSKVYHGDLYYSDLTSDWRCDTIIDIDCFPELYVGRLLADSSFLIDNYTDKLFRYELNPGKGDYSYLKRSLYTEGYEFTPNANIYLNLNPFRDSLSLYYPEPTILRDCLSNFPKGCDVLDSINTNQYGFLCSFNHGAPSGIRVYGKDNLNVWYHLWAIDTVKVLDIHNYHPDLDPETGNGLNRLNNKDYPSIYYSLACSTIPYYKLPKYNIDINYGTSFTMGKDYGGPIYIGNTCDIDRFSAVKIATAFSRRLKNACFDIGQLVALSRNDNDFKKEESAIMHNLLGDPMLEIWTNTPQSYSNISISRTNYSITVSGITDANSTIVAYLDNNGKYQKRITSSGTTFTVVSPNGSIMLYKHNHIPYIAPLLLQNYNITHSQYVIASDVTAGKYVDSGRTNGDVIVKNGVEYEIEASGTVRLEGGFQVEKGATFAVNPSCF